MTRILLILILTLGTAMASDKPVTDHAECLDRAAKLQQFEMIEVYFQTQEQTERISEICKHDQPWGYDLHRADYIKYLPLGFRDFTLTGHIRSDFYQIILHGNNYTPERSLNPEEFCRRVDEIEKYAFPNEVCSGRLAVLRKQVLSYDYVGHDYITACEATGLMLKQYRSCLKVESPDEIKSEAKSASENTEKKPLEVEKNTVVPEENTGIQRAKIKIKPNHSSAQ